MSYPTAYLWLLSRPPTHGLVVAGAPSLNNLVHSSTDTRTGTSA